jgi:hypothetical protein
MHSSKELTSSSFTLLLDDRQVSVPDLFPGFDEHDRLGIVVHQPGGALGASVLILATITAFYDIQRQRAENFFIYPDYFVFHAGQPLGNHSMLDIWPEHKEVVVADDPEAILRAVNDRAITRLLVPDSEPGQPAFGRATLAGGRLRTALAYAPGGRVHDADLVATGNEFTEAYVGAVLDQSDEIESEARAAIRAERAELVEGGRPVESYRRLSLEAARARLASATTVRSSAA